MERIAPPQFSKPTEDYLRVMTASPEVAIANPIENSETIFTYYQQAKQKGVEMLALPELGITGYSTADLFFNRHVLEGTQVALSDLAAETVDGPVLVVGAPVEKDNILYNCAVVLAEGRVAGVVPKSYLPNYSEFYEERWFTPGEDVQLDSIEVAGQTAPFGTDLLFDVNGTKLGVEICEDLFAPISPSSYHALAGAEVIINPSASNEVIGKPEYRRLLVGSAAARLACAYVYTSAGKGESNADTVYGGHQIINELGRPMAENPPFEDGALVVDIDRTYVEHDRLVNKTFANQAKQFRGSHLPYRTIEITVPRPEGEDLARNVAPEAHAHASKQEMDARYEYMFDIMAHGLAQRASDIGTQGLVIGLSGGLDSTLALLTCEYASELLGISNDLIKTVTMPGPGSSDRTQNNAADLAQAMGTDHKTMPISELSMEALEAIGHDQETQDIPYENTQARMRTLLLMNYANHCGGMVVGTGDMSEIAQGWSTYNGDHMSMYNPNAGVPKTLVKSLVRWYAENRADETTQKILLDIIDTPISPELTGNGELTQETEQNIGPFELLDFFNKEERRYGSRPNKIGYLACLAFAEKYDQATIAQWMDSYFARFTNSQWKRDAVPNGVKLGTVSHGPRTDLRMAPNTSRDWHK